MTNIKTVHISWEEINYGYVPEEEITPDQYVLGAFSQLPKIVLQEDGQWDNFLPVYECQADNFETAACTLYATQNAIEVLFKRLFNKEENYSERYNYNLIPLRPPGGSPHVVAENIRSVGLVAQEELPMTQTFEEFVAPFSEEFINLGKQWLKRYSFFHEWVFTKGNIQEKIVKMKEALKYSPLGAAVYAWAEGPDEIYESVGDPNHLTLIFGYVEGKYWKCFDTYDHSIKKLSWDFDFACVKRYHIEENISDLNSTDEKWYVKLLNFIKSFLKIK